MRYNLANHLSYHDSFTNLFVDDIGISLPEKIKYLTFGNKFDKAIEVCISNSVIYSTFNDYSQKY